MENEMEYMAFGDLALFTDPITRGGDKVTYPVPTYSALVGLSKAIYWKPTIDIVVDAVRVMNPIDLSSLGTTKPKSLNKPMSVRDIGYTTYLYKPKYQVKCHIIWNRSNHNVEDRNMKKHAAIFKRSIDRGGRHNPFLGTSECSAYIVPTKFGEGQGDYDNTDRKSLGTMFHSYDYNENGKAVAANFFHPVLEKGVINFPRPEECPKRIIK